MREAQSRLAAQDLRVLRIAVYLAQEMAALLGRSALLLAALPPAAWPVGVIG